ncbi:hypothetical protein ACFL20_00090 [Spirochaetota bacterium]
MANKIHLLVIDGQFDFCDPRGALYVPGADEDMKRLSEMIKKAGDKIGNISATLDTHRKVHIAHPIWWVDPDGNHPDPFTQISLEDVVGSKPTWFSFNPDYQERSIDYVKKLKQNGRYTLTIWPPHCLLGSNGHKVFTELYDAFDTWEDHLRGVSYTIKGFNMFTEHYSAVKADVEDPSDMTTGLNSFFISSINASDTVVIAGEALSHCVANTIRDVADEIGEGGIKKLVLLEDASSSVPGFEDEGKKFIKELKGLGMQLSKTTEFPG